MISILISNKINSTVRSQIVYFCFYLFAFLIVSNDVSAKILFDFKPSKKIEARRADNRLWNDWLKKYVTRTGYVHYAKGKKDISKIKSYLKYLLSVDFTKIKRRSGRLAYLINLYNSMVIYGVLKYHPIRSVMEIKEVSFFKLSFYFNNKKTSIDDLEKKIILPGFKEPLVHFALNCASYSCPPLRKKAYTGNRLKSQLIQQTKKYLKNKEFVKIQPSNKTIKVVELFRWYKNDLGDPRSFYKKYASSKKDISKFSVQFILYDWSLNGK